MPPTVHHEALIPDHVDEDIFDRYDFEDEKLGAGGYGSVYLAKEIGREGRAALVRGSSSAPKQRNSIGVSWLSTGCHLENEMDRSEIPAKPFDQCDADACPS